MAVLDKKDPNTIEADPTKELFVYMLIRDLTLRDAIGDLVDNSVDGAKRLRPDDDMGSSRNRLEPDSKYDGLKIDINASPEKFVISDNCGGVPSEVAREYAFRFGRPKEMPSTPGSVGQFGIGMKRALFKLGKYFSISSTASHSRFLVEENVESWITMKEWSFRFKELEESQDGSLLFNEAERGTKIVVTLLRDDTSANFKLNKFIDGLRREIEKEQLYNIHRGLQIIINGQTLASRQLHLLESDEFQIAYWKKTYEIKHETSSSKLQVEIYVGVSEEKTDHGGWYIFCNDRLIIGNDQSTVTGWGEERKIPQYHSQFNRFRGYVFFNSDNADVLPWNTVKNNMDEDNPQFKAVRLEMIRLMRPVINFLNSVHTERQKIEKPEERVLAQALANATPVALSEVSNFSEHFVAPEPSSSSQNNTIRISYSKEREQVESAKDFFGARTNSEVGVSTFDYWYEAEVGNDE